MWDVWKGYTCSAGAETTKFPKLWNARLGLLWNATTFHCSWINPEVCCFNIKMVPSDRAALLEMAKVKSGSSPSLLRPPDPPAGHPAEKTVDPSKSTRAYETSTVHQTQGELPDGTKTHEDPRGPMGPPGPWLTCLTDCRALSSRAYRTSVWPQGPGHKTDPM